MMTHDMESARSALHCIPADDRDIWLKAAMALKSGFGEAGFDMWNEWSQGSDKYSQSVARREWNSLKADGAVTIRTLFWTARKYGYRGNDASGKTTPQQIAKSDRIAQERAVQGITADSSEALKRANAKKKAGAILRAASPAKADNPYLSRKKVSPTDTLWEIDAVDATKILGYRPKSKDVALSGRLLVAPIMVDNELSTVELIDGDGRKSALAGGAKSGGFWSSHKLPDGDGEGLAVLIGEGVATALSAHQATGHPVVAAFTCGNLKKVAIALCKRYPKAALVVLADLGNGEKKADEAARAVGGAVARPDFGADRPDDATDFNDMAASLGSEAVASAISAAATTPGDEPDEKAVHSKMLDIDALIAAIPSVEGKNEARKLRSAMAAIKLDSKLPDSKHDASSTIGYALCTTYGDSSHPALGRALCQEWDNSTGGNSVSVFDAADPNYSHGKGPVTTNSLFKLAQASGWDGDFEAEWGEPKPIQSSLKPVQMFDADALLPEILRDWIADEADRMPCPQDYIAAPALVTLGSVIGARCSIKPKALDAWQVVPNLWGGIVAPPSAKKSPAIDAALRPLNRLVTQAIENHKKEMGSFEIDRMVADARAEAIESRIKKEAKSATNDSNGSSLEELVKDFRALKNSAVETPALRRYKTNDTTIEKLGELLRDNPAGLLTSRDELVGLLVNWEREGHEGDRAFYLEGWNGTGSFDTDRIGRGTILIPNLCVSIFGGIQPDKLIAYLEQASHALANDGMLQRFQVLVYPDPCEWDWRDRTPNQVVRDKVFSLYETLASFEPTAWGAAPADAFNKFPYFRFDAEAQGIFVEWSSDLQRNKIPKEDHPIIAQHLAKFEKLFTALALIFHLVECAINKRRGPVMADCALRAAAWCDYLESHARRCYGLLMDEGMRSAQALAERITRGDLKDGFTARDVRRNQWRYLTTDEAVKAALIWLSDEHWLRSQKVGGAGPGSGRPTFQYLINPAIAKDAR